MKKLKVLQDLWVPFVGGYAGIPQDTRHVFNALASLKEIELSGFLYAKNKLSAVRGKKASSDFCDIVFNDLLSKENDFSYFYKVKTFLSLFMSNSILKYQYDFLPIQSSYNEMLWKNIFAKTLIPEDKLNVLKHNFYCSDISWRDMMYATLFQRKVSLNTSDYDVVIFPDVRAVSVSPSTKKIVRYHDAFPIQCPDFFHKYDSLMHLNSLKACVKDAFFACDSIPTQNVLLELYPELENKSFVIPPVIGKQKKNKNGKKLQEIFAARASQLSLKTKPEQHEVENFEYILALSTLEPRKNYLNLIKAWENLCYQYKQNIKLVIIANPGWLSQEIEEKMIPHIKLGNIIHLTQVSSDEMPYVFSHATLFASLSFAEGFGIPPLEAMQYECPVLASDISTYRWTMDSAALFVDPYDVESITEGMAKLVCLEGASELRYHLIKQGVKKINAYSLENVSQQWESVLHHLHYTTGRVAS